MNNLNSNTRKFLLIGVLTAFLFFALETVLFSGLRFTTTHFQAQLIIALSLVGMVIGGVYAAATADKQFARRISMAVSLYALLPFVGGVGVLISFTHPFVSSALITLAFIPFGFVLALLYRVIDPWRLYAAELVGAALGLFAALVFIPLMREENSAIAIALIGAAAFLVLGWRQLVLRQRLLAPTLVLFVFVLLISNLHGGYINLTTDADCSIARERSVGVFKIACLDEAGLAYSVEYSKSSVVDRVDVVSTARGARMMLAAFSGTRNDIIQPFDASHYELDARIPDVFNEPKTLIIGAGAEGIAKVAKAIGARDITVVELNPAIVSLWKNNAEINEYAHEPFSDTTLIQEEGRTFLSSTKETYDLITLMNTHRTRDLGQFGLPDFLHTKEAFALMYERLSDDGVLMIEEANFDGDADEPIVKVVHTLYEALRAKGVDAPGQYVAAYEWVGVGRGEKLQGSYPLVYTQLAVKRTPWSKADIEQFSQWAARSHDTSNHTKDNNMVFYRWLWLPNVEEQVGGPIASVLSGQVGSDRILTDLSPFPTTPSRHDRSLLVIALGVLAVSIGEVLYRFGIRRGEKERVYTLLYFVLIGVGYMLVEMFLLTFLPLLLGSVLLSFAVAIGGLFIAGAAASLWWSSRPLVPSHLFRALALAAVVIAAVLFVSQEIFSHMPSILRIVLALSISSLLGALLAVFFPAGIVRARAAFKQDTAVLVGINGTALALGVPIAMLLAGVGGFVLLVVSALVFYLGAIAVWKGVRYTE